MSIEDDIIGWADTRPNWQRVAVRRILAGEHLRQAEFEQIAERLIRDGWEPLETLGAVTAQPEAPREDAVSLASIGRAVHCNALSSDQVLDFDPAGITIVYGDNGSGKSGYARLIKKIVGARHQEEVLSNIFCDAESAEQSAEVVVQVGGSRTTLAWPSGSTSDVRRIKFFDESCGETFLTRETEVSYRPPGLSVMDELIRVCDGVREVLEKRLQEIRDDGTELPLVADGTKSHEFLRGLTGRTTQADIDLACTPPSNIDERLESARAEEQRWRAADPFGEQQRLQTQAARVRQLAGHLSACDAALGTAAAARLEKLARDVEAKRAAVRVASSTSFDSEPLRGVGGAEWTVLWEAARKYAASAYPEKAFPNVEAGARCVLCQQEFDKDAAARLQRFEAFVRAEARRAADESDRKKAVATKEVSSFVPKTVDGLLALELIGADHGEISALIMRWLGDYEARREEILACDRGEKPWAELRQVQGLDTARLIALAEQLERDAVSLDATAFATKLAKAVLDRMELESKKTLSEHRATIEAEVRRCAAIEALEGAKRLTVTTGISKKAADLTRDHSSVVTRDRFTRESDRLRVERVTLQDRGGPKGTLQQKPAFVGAIQSASLPAVLSEGEQKALGLAGFFTDVVLSPTRSAIVLDDPVTSLDHVRREHVAERLVQFAVERQVIVFTHDASFIVDLRKAAERAEVKVTERSVERKGTGEPGVCKPTHPWKAKDVSARIGKLKNDLPAIRKAQATADQEQHEKACADWAGSLSETWERMIAHEVVGAVVDRGTLEVRPAQFRVLARLTEQDNIEFQTSYAKTSRWARRHDKSTELNYTAPPIADMEQELELVEAWFKRLKTYKQT